MAPLGSVDIDSRVVGEGFPTTLSAYVGAVLVSAIQLKVILSTHPPYFCCLKFEVFLFGELARRKLWDLDAHANRLMAMYRPLYDLIRDQHLRPIMQ